MALLLIILIPLLLLTIYSLIHAYKAQNKGSYNLAIICLILFVATYAVGILDFKVTGDSFGLEKKVEKIEFEQEQLNQIVKILIKMIYVAKDQAEYIGAQPQHDKQLIELSNDLEDFIGKDFNKEIEELLDHLKPKQ